MTWSASCSTFGGFADPTLDAIQFAAARGKIYKGSTIDDPHVSFRSIAQRLQVSTLKGIARQILRRLPVTDPFDYGDPGSSDLPAPKVFQPRSFLPGYSDPGRVCLRKATPETST